MSDIIRVMVLVEGQTEQTFINNIFSPYITRLTENKVFLFPTQPGKLGGDVRFERYKKDIGLHLKQSADTYITLMLDYYGIKISESFVKTTTGIAIAKAVNIPRMRECCPLFNEWVNTIETLKPL
jgi:hypothetical protein